MRAVNAWLEGICNAHAQGDLELEESIRKYLGASLGCERGDNCTRSHHTLSCHGEILGNQRGRVLFGLHRCLPNRIASKLYVGMCASFGLRESRAIFF